MDVSQCPPRRTTIRSLAVVVSQCSGVPVSDIIGHRRFAALAKARHILSWLARRYTRSSAPVIATHTGRREHTTALYSVARVHLAIREADIAAPADDVAEAWAAILWVTPWPALNSRDPMRLGRP
jgi:chromosomal replication initiation ATPase DnaA